MIVITGGAGFIGSAFAWKCNQEGRDDLIIVDNVNTSEKWKNLVGLQYAEYFHKDDFIEAILSGGIPFEVDAIVHMGACSATTELDMDYLFQNNYDYTKILAEYCAAENIRFIYASSAATYGDGALGFDDNEDDIFQLKPINRYGYSKHLFDLFALKSGLINNIVGLKFFNVFGPNEAHKEGMRSVVAKSYLNIARDKKIQLFRSNHPDYKDGGQQRDFVYVKDVVNVMWWLLNNSHVNGIYNVGTGESRSWNDLAAAMFSSMDIPLNIEYIDMPDNLKGQYQNYTQASMEKLKSKGCDVNFMTLEQAIDDYIKGYLSTNKLLA